VNKQMIDIEKINQLEISCEFKWLKHYHLKVGQLIRIDGHLCKVVAVGEDGSVTLEKAKESE